jgi:hypothetical protein
MRGMVRRGEGARLHASSALVALDTLYGYSAIGSIAVITLFNDVRSMTDEHRDLFEDRAAILRQVTLARGAS